MRGARTFLSPDFKRYWVRAAAKMLVASTASKELSCAWRMNDLPRPAFRQLTSAGLLLLLETYEDLWAMVMRNLLSLRRNGLGISC
jgi:hypothetical protein